MAKQPKIRFKGFTEEWKEKTFSELYYRAIEKNDLSFGPDKIISVANMFYRPDASGVSTDEYMRTYNIMRVGDIAYEGNKSANFANGRWVENYIGDGIISHVFEVLRPKTKYDLMYWRYAINNEHIMRRKLMLSTKKATMMTNIVVPDFLKQTISVPTIPEQEKIGGLLSHVDSTISQRETELEKLKNIKRALFEKLFPQEGQSTPTIRFKGFNEKWSDGKISDLLIERDEQFPQNSDYPLMAFVANYGIVPKGERYDRSALIKDGINKPYKRTMYGDFIYSSNNLESGSIGMNYYGNASISPVYSIFAPKEKNNPIFLGMRLSMPDIIHKMVLKRQGVIYGQWKIHESEFLSIPVCVPKIDEQNKIASAIDRLATIISLRERQLTLLKHSKQALLEQMFVNE